MNIDPTGVSDSGPGLTVAFADLLASGQVPYLRGAFLVTTAAPPAAGQDLFVAPGTTFTGANAASIANVAFVLGAAPGTPAYNPAWYALTDVYWDPVGGSDANAGNVSARRPALRRDRPPLRLDVARHQLRPGRHHPHAQLAAGGPGSGFFEPRVSGGGRAILLGSLVPFGAPFALGALTAAKVRGAPGSLTKADLSAGPGGIVKNMLLVNTTQAQPGDHRLAGRHPRDDAAAYRHGGPHEHGGSPGSGRRRHVGEHPDGAGVHADQHQPEAMAPGGRGCHPPR